MRAGISNKMSFSAAGAEADVLTGKAEHHFLNRLLLKLRTFERNAELLMNAFEVSLFAGIGEEAKMANFHIAFREDV